MVKLERGARVDLAPRGPSEHPGRGARRSGRGRNRLFGAVTAVLLVSAMALAAQGSSGDPRASSPLDRPAHFKLSDGAPSIDALLRRVLDALAAKDVQALHRLRVTEQEYRSFVLPGAVEKGQPPQNLDEQSSQFAWDMLNTKSLYAGQAIITNFGGRHYTLKDVQYAKGQHQYAWYATYNTTVLTLQDDAGGMRELTLGSIADVDGQFKFVGLLGNR